MTIKKHAVHYANFVCHFGPAELLTYLEEIVIPAFLEPRQRIFKEGKYFFHDAQVLDLGTQPGQSEMAICGRFIKDMVVRSEQRFDPETQTLRRSIQQMETAPSAIFVLLLASHKLIYLSETGSAPGMESFRSTVSNFLGQARTAYVNDVVDRAREAPLVADEAVMFQARDETGNIERLTKQRMYELIPRPELELVPLSNEESLRSFVNRFATLQSASIRLVRPNSEIDSEDFFEALRDKAEKVGSETSSLVYKNPDGLEKTEIVAQLEVAASDGNTEINLAGKDASGQKLRGSNHEFKVVSFIEGQLGAVKDTARAMWNLFKSQRASGSIKLPKSEITPQNAARLTKLVVRQILTRDD